jgi:hypothetical protein
VDALQYVLQNAPLGTKNPVVKVSCFAYCLPGK